jgi:glycolate oxidase iron-sulfur subunit
MLPKCWPPSRSRWPSCCARRVGVGERVAFHSPCTLQHAQKIRGVVETLLTAAGYQLSPVADRAPVLRFGGNLFDQPAGAGHAVARQQAGGHGAGSPAVMVTANIGCQTHLQSGSKMPVRHWIELIDERLSGGA